MLTEAQVRDCMRNAGIKAEQSELPSNADLRSHGLDSLDMFNLLAELESMSGVKIPDDVVPELNTIDAILKFVNGAQ